MQMDSISSSSLDIDQSIDSITSGFNGQLQLECNDDSASKLLPAPEARVDAEDREDCENEERNDDDDDDDDFTFMFIKDDASQIYGEKVLEDDQIHPVFPLFDQKLLFDGEYDVEEVDRLPIQPPVDRIFIQSPRGFPSFPATEHDDDDDATTGPYCAWSKESATGSGTGTAELSKKSNSTGFSKLWRLKDIVGRSNSSDRDAFVFLKSSDRSTAATTGSSSSSSSKSVSGDGKFVKVNVAGGKARVVKGKKSPVSAHEAYLKSRGQTEEERRRSYLPYRPELMGFFTNVNGGLTKNVHPY